MSILSDKAMLSHIRVSTWTARKIDRKVTDDINKANEAAADAGRYNKLLLDKDALAPIMSVVSEARTYHYSRTMPWSDEGARLLPALAYMSYVAMVAVHKNKFEAAVSDFLATYAQNVECARKRLGNMFRESDYPTVSEIKTKFAFEMIINPVPAGDDFRVNVGDAQAEQIRADIEERAERQLRDAMGDLYRRIGKVTESMVDRLRAYKPAKGQSKAEGIFRDSLVENVRELAGLLPTLNVTSDPHLAALAKRMQDELTLHTAEELRDNSRLRESVADAAAAILDDISDFLA